MTAAPHALDDRATSTQGDVRTAVAAIWPLYRWPAIGWAVTSVVVFAILVFFVSTQFIVDPTFPMSHIVVFNLRVWIAIVVITNTALYFTPLVGQGMTRRTFVAGNGMVLTGMAVVSASMAAAAVAIEAAMFAGLDWASNVLPRTWSDPDQLALVWSGEFAATVLWGVTGWAVTAVWYRHGWLAGIPAAVVAFAMITGLASIMAGADRPALWAFTALAVAAIIATIARWVTIGTSLNRSSPWAASAGH